MARPAGREARERERPQDGQGARLYHHVSRAERADSARWARPSRELPARRARRLFGQLGLQYAPVTGAPIYLVSACTSGEEFVAAFRRYADKTGLFVPIGEPLPAGSRSRFAVTLRD